MGVPRNPIFYYHHIHQFFPWTCNLMGIPYTIFLDTFIYIFSMACILFILFIVFHSCSIFFYGANMDSSHSVQCSTVVPFFSHVIGFPHVFKCFPNFFRWIFHIFLPVHLVAKCHDPWPEVFGWTDVLVSVTDTGSGGLRLATGRSFGDWGCQNFRWNSTWLGKWILMDYDYWGTGSSIMLDYDSDGFWYIWLILV